MVYYTFSGGRGSLTYSHSTLPSNVLYPHDTTECDFASLTHISPQSKAHPVFFLLGNERPQSPLSDFDLLKGDSFTKTSS